MPLSQLVLIESDSEIYDISRAAKSSLRSAVQTRGICCNARIPTRENLLTSVPTQNVDSAELTDIKQILNVLLKKNNDI